MRTAALQRLKLKAVIKESHCSPVQHLDMNMADHTCRNLFATVAKDQVTIYDDMHMGDHLSVVSNLALTANLEDAKDLFSTCCWIRTAEITQHPYGDALLAVGGSDSCVSIISVVEAAVVGRLPLPPGCAVADVAGAAGCPGLLMVLCWDGTLQLWQICTGACLWTCKTDAFTAALHPQGTCVLTASRTGKVSQWDLQALDVSPAAHRSAAATAPAVSKQAWHAPGQGDAPVDCVCFLTEALVATKTVDGYMAVYSWPCSKLISSWKVPGSGSSSSTPSLSKRCCFGHTRDGQYICVGNQLATAFVYDTRTGRQLVRVEAIRVQGPVRACGLSEDCRHLLMVAGHGYVFRFEAGPPADEGPDRGSSSSDTDAGDGEDQQQQAATLPQPQPEQQQQPQRQQQQEPQVVPTNDQPHNAGSSSQQAVQQLQQQQQHSQPQQMQLPHGPLQPAPGSLSRPPPPAEWQQHCVQHGVGPMPAASDGAGTLDPCTTGSQDALMGTPSGVGGANAVQDSMLQQQYEDRAGLCTEGLDRSKRPKLDMDDSPLVFRPTPRKH